MTVLVSLESETGFLRRYVSSSKPTHFAALTNDPTNADATRATIEKFRVTPNPRFMVNCGSFEGALAKQRADREKASG